MLLFDRLVNLVSGLGTTKDKLTANAFGLTLLTRPELEAMYRSDWLAAKIVDIVPFDMTREWRNWQADETQIEKLETAERLLRVRDKVALALKRGRLYGGAALYVSIAGQRPETPLNIQTVRAGSVEFLHVLSPHELVQGEIERDPLSPFFGEPIYYEVPTTKGDRPRIHPSRVIRFVGTPVPDPAVDATGWGDSILQRVYDAVQNASSAQQHIASLLPEAKVDVIKVPGLSEALSTTTGTARLTSRFALANQLKSTQNMLLLEGDGESGESWEQKQIKFDQFPDLMRLFLQVAAGAADIPVTRLLGQSPAGLNSTGDSDIRNYYDHLASRQEVDLRPSLDRLDEILIPHALGSRPPEVHYTFAPLWQLSDKEKADIGKVKADTWSVMSVNALVPSPVLEQAVRNSLIESGEMPGIEQAYEDFDKGLLEDEDEPAPEVVPPDQTGEGAKVAEA